MLPAATKGGGMLGGPSPSCIFCQIARSSTSTPLLHSVGFLSLSLSLSLIDAKLLLIRVQIMQDEKVVAFPDINPSAFRHYLVISKEHIPTVKDLQRRTEDFSLVSHMLNVGQNLLQRDAPQKQYRFGFHQPPVNSVDHLHLHCLALPFEPRWRCVKYLSLGPLGGFIEAEKLLERIKPVLSTPLKL